MPRDVPTSTAALEAWLTEEAEKRSSADLKIAEQLHALFRVVELLTGEVEHLAREVKRLSDEQHP